jgi:hypothetical protein
VKELSIIIACDADPDRERFGAQKLEGTEVPLSWQGIELGLPKLIQQVSPLKDALGQSPRFTWFIRADHQIAQLMESEEAAYMKHRNFWEAWAAQGDECAWHPHYWRINPKNGFWEQEQNDTLWMSAMLKSSFIKLRQHIELHSVKTGWCTMDNLTMNTLKDLGLLCECSAMPMQVYEPQRQASQAYYGAYDWQHTQQQAYWPSLADYRKPHDTSATTKNSFSCELLEIPISAGEDRLTTHLENFVLALRRKTWPSARPGQRKTSLKITFAPWLFQRLWRGLLPQIQNLQKPFVHVYFHPDECLPERGLQAKAYSRQNASANLNFILKESQRLGYQPIYRTSRAYRTRFLDKDRS